jgi:hypothetical protein
MTLTTTIAAKIMAAAGIALIVLSMVNSVTNVQSLATPNSVTYDSKFVAAMDNLSSVIPDGAVIVVSTNAPRVAYFTGHKTVTPYTASSNDSLIKYMQARGYSYLVVFEGQSDVPALRTLFSSTGLTALEPAFTQLAVYETDFYVIHVYQLK